MPSDKERVRNLIESALYSIDVGGEQSREFANEIRWLKRAIRILKNSIRRK